MNQKPSFRDIADALRNDPEPFATSVIGETPTYKGSNQVRYYENGSLVVFTSGPSQGRFKSFLDENFKGDMIDLFKELKGASDFEAIEYAKRHLGLGGSDVDFSKLKSGPSPEERKKQQDAEDAKRIRTANWIWDSASATDGREEGLAYLAGRAITCDIPSTTLRFRRLSRSDLEKMGVPAAEIPATPVVALIFAARNLSGKITAVQQILTTEGKKVKFDNPKRTNGIMQGAGIWLGNPKAGTTAALVEGPETGCSIFQATGLPTCITLGTSNFTKVAVPQNIECLITASDMEPTGVGLASALRTAQFWSAEGVEKSGIALPRLNSGDFNDVLQQHGDEAVAAAFTTAFFPPERQRDGTVLITADARAAFHAWIKTGLEVLPRVPGRNKDGKFFPISLDNEVSDHHNRVLLVNNPAIEVRDDILRKMRPEVEIIELHTDSRAFRDLAKEPGAIEAMIDVIDMYAPKGFGTDEPAFFSLRRSDADSLDLDGYLSIAVRASAVRRINFDFMKGREAIVAPIGYGTEYDETLTDRLCAAGAKVTRLTWQIFRGDDAAPSILRRSVPANFGAVDAASEGWTGQALVDLIDISRANYAQMAKKAIQGAADDQPHLEAAAS